MPSFEEGFKAATTPGPDRVTPGAVLIVADKTGQIRYLNESGLTSVDPEKASPINVDSAFWIASCTKLMTTVAVMQCVEKDLVSLDEDVSRLLPEWKSPDILTGFDKETGEPLLKKVTKKITLRQLLTHSSGMGYEFLSRELMAWRAWTKEDPKAIEGDIRKQYTMPLLYEPGEGWNYSCGIDWAGQIVERVNGGMRLGDYMKDHIWKPLGMKLTAFQLAEHPEVLSNLCSMTAKTASGELVPTTPLRKQNPKDDLGDGGLYSAPSDYIKLLIALLKNDGTLLKPETVEHMFSPQLPDDKYLRTALSDPETGPMFTSGVKNSMEWNWGLGGILNMESVEGIANKGTMTWGGLPNLFWWIDPTRENCGLYASQLVPPGDPASLALAIAFRREMFKETAKM